MRTHTHTHTHTHTQLLMSSGDLVVDIDNILSLKKKWFVYHHPLIDKGSLGERERGREGGRERETDRQR